MRQAQLDRLSVMIGNDGFVRTINNQPPDDENTKTGGTIFLLMDSFSRADVQQRICNICEKLMNAFNDIRYVFVEGDYDAVDVSKAFNWSSSKITEQLNEGRLKGPELLLITRHNDLNFTIQGIDDEELHDRQHEILKNTIKYEKQFSSDITLMRNIMKQAIQILCKNPLNEITEIIDNYESFESNAIKLIPYCVALKKHLYKIYYNDLIDASKFLDGIIAGKEPDPSIYLSGLLQDLHEIFIRLLEDALARADNPILKEFVKFYMQCKNAATIFQLSLSNSAYLKVVTGEKIKDWFSFDVLQNACRIIGLPCPAISLAPIREKLKYALEFYELTDKRNQIMGRKVVELMKKMKQKTAIVVTGGYHTSRLYSFLDYNKDMEIAVIMPKVDENSVSHYIKIMQ